MRLFLAVAQMPRRNNNAMAVRRSARANASSALGRRTAGALLGAALLLGLQLPSAHAARGLMDVTGSGPNTTLGERLVQLAHLQQAADPLLLDAARQVAPASITDSLIVLGERRVRCGALEACTGAALTTQTRLSSACMCSATAASRSSARGEQQRSPCRSQQQQRRFSGT